MTFTYPYNWEGNPDVKQILVFSCVEDEIQACRSLEKFGLGFKDVSPMTFLDESNLGAIYKLQAVPYEKRLYKGVIRSGKSGAIISELLDISFEDPEKVLTMLKSLLEDQ